MTVTTQRFTFEGHKGGFFVFSFKHAAFVSAAAAALMAAAASVAVAQPDDYTQGIKAKEPQAVKITARDSANASTDEHQLLAKLKGVVLVGAPGQVKAKGASGAGVVVKADNVPAAVAVAAGAYLGKPVSPASLDRMTRDMVLAYRSAGLPVVNVVVPPQDVTNGVVQIVVVIGHLGKVIVQGNAANPSYYTEGFTLKSGDVITEGAVLDQLRWKSRRQNRRVDAVYSPGSAYGMTDLTLDVKESKPWNVFIGADNTGSGALGEDRFYTGFVIDNLWGKDHEFSYQYTTSELGPSALSAHAASYTMPILGRTDYQLSGSYVLSSAAVGPGTSSGTSYSLTSQFISQLPRLGSVSLDAHYGSEYKYSDNNFAFGGTPVSGTRTEVAQVFGQILGQHASGMDNTRFDVGVWASPGGLFTNNTDAAFDALRKGSVAEYVYSRANLDETIYLPKDFMFEAKFEGQLASNRLNPSEMIYLGGMNSVRGFNENAVSGDNGIFGRFQLFTPSLSLAHNKQDSLRAYGFFDAGYVNTISPQAGEGDSTIAGAGVGLLYQYSQNISAELAYGWRVKTDTLVTNNDAGALHFRVMARF